MRHVVAIIFVAQPNSSQNYKRFQPAKYFSALAEIQLISAFQTLNLQTPCINVGGLCFKLLPPLHLKFSILIRPTSFALISLHLRNVADVATWK